MINNSISIGFHPNLISRVNNLHFNSTSAFKFMAIPLGLQYPLIERLQNYRKQNWRSYPKRFCDFVEVQIEPNGYEKWLLKEHSYRLIIATIERNLDNTWRFPQGQQITFPLMKQKFNHLITNADIAITSIIFVLMSEVSSNAIKNQEFPVAENEKPKLFGNQEFNNHRSRDIRFSKNLIFAAPSGPPKQLAISIQEYFNGVNIQKFRFNIDDFPAL